MTLKENLGGFLQLDLSFDFRLTPVYLQRSYWAVTVKQVP